MNCKSENINIFAVYFAKVCFISMICSSYFYGYMKAIICKDKEAIKSQWLLHSCCNCTLASMGGDSLSYVLYLTISFTMPKYNEIATLPNKSKQVRTVSHETGMSRYGFKYSVESSSSYGFFNLYRNDSFIMLMDGDDFQLLINVLSNARDKLTERVVHKSKVQTKIDIPQFGWTLIINNDPPKKKRNGRKTM